MAAQSDTEPLRLHRNEIENEANQRRPNKILHLGSYRQKPSEFGPHPARGIRRKSYQAAGSTPLLGRVRFSLRL